MIQKLISYKKWWTIFMCKRSTFKNLEFYHENILINNPGIDAAIRLKNEKNRGESIDSHHIQQRGLVLYYCMSAEDLIGLCAVKKKRHAFYLGTSR